MHGGGINPQSGQCSMVSQSLAASLSILIVPFSSSSPPEFLYQLLDCKASFVFADPELLPVALKAFELLHKTSGAQSPFADDKYALQHTFLARRLTASQRALEGVRSTGLNIDGPATIDTSFLSYADLLVSEKDARNVVVPVPLGPEGCQQTAVLCYSSGTTGLPKGVELTHRNLTSVLAQFAVAMPPCLGPDESTPAFL